MTNHNEFKEKLEAKLVAVTTELEQIATFNEVTSDWETRREQEEWGSTADENTNADAAENLEARTAAVTQLENEFNNIRRALSKISDGTYGICEISGEPIEENRLKFIPEARTCSQHMNEESSLPL